MEDLENGTIAQMAQTGVSVMAEGAAAQNRRSPPPAVPSTALVAPSRNVAPPKPQPTTRSTATANPAPAPRTRPQDVQRSRVAPAVSRTSPEANRPSAQDRRSAPPTTAARSGMASASGPSTNTEDAARRKADFLRTVAAGTRMRALTCPGGDGRIFATGTRPRPRPEVVACIDVHFRARCDRSDVTSAGVATNFTGHAGCFGDTYAIQPKPACAPERVRIEVVEARACGE